MKDNARHVPGSTRSCRTRLSRSATAAWRFQIFAKSTYKTQTKRRQNRKCDFFSSSASTVYNFNALTCLNFPIDHNLDPNLNLTRSPVEPCEAPGARAAARSSIRTIISHSSHHLHSSQCANELATTVHNRTNPDDFRFFRKPNTLYQRLTTTPRSVVRFWNSRLDPRRSPLDARWRLRPSPENEIK